MKESFLKAFTLIEIIIVIAIFSSVIFVAFSSFPKISSRQNADLFVDKVTDFIVIARNNALLNKEGAVWGVCSLGSRVILYKSSCVENNVQLYAETPEDITLSGLSGLEFSRVYAQSGSGEVNIEVTVSARKAVIEISGEGGINEYIQSN